jgi:hypothetical protein
MEKLTKVLFKCSLVKMTLRKGNHQMGWIIMNCWKRVIEKLDFSCCNLVSIPSIPQRHCNSLKELDISGLHTKNFLQSKQIQSRN